MKLVLSASAALGAWLGWRSLGWPLIHDAPIMHYIAWVISLGGVPYRDAFDMNLPGVYLIHWTILSIGGRGDVAWRVFDLGWLAATCALLFAYCRPMSDGVAAGLASVLFALYHLSGGAWRAGQRDYLLCVFLLAGAYGAALSRERGGGMASLLAGGVALGAGIMVKPVAGVFWLACAAAAAQGAARGRRAIAGAAVLAGGLIVPALVFGWLGARGGLGAFLDVLGGYVLPLYSRLARVGVAEAFREYPHGWQLWTLLAALGALGAWSPAASPFGHRKALAAMGVGYGVVHFLVQGKGWEYQLYPLALFLCALASPAMVRASGREGSEVRAASPRRWAVLAVLAGVLVVLGQKGAEATDPPWIEEKAARVAALTRDLSGIVPAGSTVQVMDVTEGGIHALLNLGLRQPTRFIYDFHFFHDEGDPRIQRLRAEFAAALAAAPPAAVVVLRDTWNRPGYDRLKSFPEVAGLLDREYVLAVDRDDYRIYAKRAHS